MKLLLPDPSRLAPLVVDPAEIPDENRPHPPGLTWVAPLEARPIQLGPSADHPELRPALAIDAGRFWAVSRHGLEVGRAQIDLEEGAVWFAIAPNMRTAPERVAYLVDAAEAWGRATANAAHEMAGAL